MKKSNIYNVLSIICFVVYAIIMIFQVIHPHPVMKTRQFIGLIGFLTMMTGFYFANKLKSPFYDPDKKKHIRNWVIFFLAITITVVMIGLIYWIYLSVSK